MATRTLMGDAEADEALESARAAHCRPGRSDRHRFLHANVLGFAAALALAFVVGIAMGVTVMSFRVSRDVSTVNVRAATELMSEVPMSQPARAPAARESPAPQLRSRGVAAFAASEPQKGGAGERRMITWPFKTPLLEQAEQSEGANLTYPVHITSPSWPCRPGEEFFFGKCYVTCKTVTKGMYNFRMDTCTCVKSLPVPIDLPGLSYTDCDLLNRDLDDAAPSGPKLTNCRLENEELFGGLCYLKCSVLTYGRYTNRTGMNTCSNGQYGGDWTMGIGPCSGFGIGGDQCLPHIPAPTGVGYDTGSPSQAGVPPLGIVGSVVKAMVPVTVASLETAAGVEKPKE